MRNIHVFNYVTLDGFFAGPRGEIDWFKNIRRDDELDEYSHSQSRAGGTLIFGRTTYEMMKAYWPTKEAITLDPEMAKTMDESQKIVFSKTLSNVSESPTWKNVRLFHDITREGILDLKKHEKNDFVILGSGSVVQQFANLGLIDEYQLLVVPVVLGAGKNLFDNVTTTTLELLDARSFSNGIVMLKYKPLKKRTD